MKHLFLPFALVILSLGYWQSFVTIEKPILTSETLGLFKAEFEALDSKAVARVEAYGSSSGGSLWDRQAARRTSYFVDINCAPQDASALVEDFHVQLLDALEAAGATIAKDEVLEGDKLSEPLEFSDNQHAQADSPINKDRHSGFSIAYSKSKVVGGISVGYTLTDGGQNILLMYQVEDQ
jgi:hypothetical protein